MPDPQLGSGTRRRFHHLPTAQHPALQAGHGAVLLSPLQHREDDVGLLGGLGEEEVGDHQQIQGPQVLHHAVRIGGGDGHVGAVHEQRSHTPGRAHGVEQLGGRGARAGDLGSLHLPHPGHVRPVGRIGDGPGPGQLVGLLAHLPAALAVALAGEGAVPSGAGAGQPQQQRQVDGRTGGVGAVVMLLHPAPGENVDGIPALVRPLGGVAQTPRQEADLVRADAGHRLGAFGPPVGHRAAEGLQPGDPVLQVLGGVEAFLEEDVGHREQQHQVPTGGRGHVETAAVGGELGGAAAAGIHHDQPAAGLCPLEVLHEGRHGVGHVGPQQQHGACGVQVSQREGEPAVQSEGQGGRL